MNPLPADRDGWRPRMVVLDLDGTVVAARVSPSARPIPSRAVRAAVAGVRAAGVPVVVATGRSLWGSLDTVAALGLEGIRLVCSNGAVGYDLACGQVTHQIRFDPRPVVAALAEALPGIGFAAEQGTAGFMTTAEFRRDFSSRFLDEVSVSELAAVETTRLVCRADGHAADAVTAAAAQVLPGTGTRWFSQRPQWLDVGSQEASKASGVAAVAAGLGIKAADVIAFGDDYNDLDLFAWAGCAVAMGQAAPAIRAAADHVTGSVDADGVATTLARWFPPSRKDPK